jgi:accessory gene regulator protein AgrB
MPENTITIAEIEPGELINKVKAVTIHEETIFIIPENYKITERDYQYILKYEYNISIQRQKKDEAA